jgi:hypothetical protein
MAKLQHRELEKNPDIAAMEALEFARSLPHGLARTEALKQAGLLRHQADLRGIAFAKGRPRKG